MFHHIEGKVSDLEPYLAVLDCGGVGYALNTTLYTLSELKLGERAKLYVYESIREDCFDLYGFSTKAEKRSFELLVGVSGVGPKAALSILSSTTPQNLAVAILSGDERALTVAPGIGKKIAQRVILELKDKIAKEGEALEIPAASAALPASMGDKNVNDAMAALSVLGYGTGEISSALRTIDVSGLKTEEIIKAALKNMMK